MKHLEAIVFDLDDTLYYERDFMASGFTAVARWIERRFEISTGSTLSQLMAIADQGHISDTFDCWLSRTPLPASVAIEDLVAVYRSHIPEIRPIDGVPELLERLHRRYRLALLTDGRIEGQQLKIDALGIANRFEYVLISDALGREFWKPSVKPFEFVLDQLGVSPDGAVYVGDNPLKDFFGARALGMTTIRVRDPRGLHADAEPPTHAHAPDATIASVQALEKELERLQYA